MLHISQSALKTGSRTLSGWSRIAGCSRKVVGSPRKSGYGLPGASGLPSRFFMASAKENMAKALAFSRELTMAFWTGGKQLWKNYWASQALQKKASAGEVLTRAEHRFVLQTSSDLWVRRCDGNRTEITGCQIRRRSSRCHASHPLAVTDLPIFLLKKLLPVLLINMLPGSVVFLGLYIAALPTALPSTIRVQAWVVRSASPTLQLVSVTNLPICHRKKLEPVSRRRSRTVLKQS